MSDVEWPPGFDRTPPAEREPYPNTFRVDLQRAFEEILDELRKLGVDEIKISSGTDHQRENPNVPYAGAPTKVDDPAVVVYFEKAGEEYAVPCDRWDNVRDNAQAIAKYLEAKRPLEEDRYGVETIESEFSTSKLPSGDETGGSPLASEEDPYEVLGVHPTADDEKVKEVAKIRKKAEHPDNGGDREEFKRVVAAEEAILDE